MASEPFLLFRIKIHKIFSSLSVRWRRDVVVSSVFWAEIRWWRLFRGRGTLRNKLRGRQNRGRKLSPGVFSYLPHEIVPCFACIFILFFHPPPVVFLTWIKIESVGDDDDAVGWWRVEKKKIYFIISLAPFYCSNFHHPWEEIKKIKVWMGRRRRSLFTFSGHTHRRRAWWQRL